MSDMKPDGGPAFPQPATSEGHATNTLEGMSLRDWFAGRALAIHANVWSDPEVAHDVGVTVAQMVARRAYAYADAMLAERSQSTLMDPLTKMHAAFADRFGDRPEPQFYDFPWGRRRICPETHERTIGGDGYGDRCCGTADVEAVQESEPDCPIGYCADHCGERCTHWQEATHCYGYVGCNEADTSTCECACERCAAARAV